MFFALPARWRATVKRRVLLNFSASCAALVLDFDFSF